MIIDAHLYNNQLLSERDEVVNDRPINDTHDRRLQESNTALQEYGYNIRQNYEQAQQLMGEFEERFDAVISNLEISA